MTIGVIGWVATAVFGASYLSRRASTLRKVQMGAACLWIFYGLAIGAAPVVAANVIVAGAALASLLRRAPRVKPRRSSKATGSARGPQEDP